MPSETRASKRLKKSHPQPHLTQYMPMAAHQRQLRKLNALSPTEFRNTYIPDSWLTFQSSKLPNTELTLEYYAASDLSDAQYAACLDLLVATSKEDYVLSSRGWNPVHKKKEMREANMRYFIVRRCEKSQTTNDVEARSGSDCTSTSTSPTSSQDSTPESPLGKQNKYLDDFGFLSYQLDDDWTLNPDVRLPVLYLYEIHLGANLRGIGLGKHMMDLAKHIAEATKMAKVELSVFTRNAHADNFYRSLAYETDETSPTKARKGRRIIKTDWLVLSLRIEPGVLKTDDEDEDTA